MDKPSLENDRESLVNIFLLLCLLFYFLYRHLCKKFGRSVNLYQLKRQVEMQYTPDWKSLDSRPLPTWYDSAKLGIFMHFGPYSVPGVQSEWFWMQSVRNESPGDKKCSQYLKDYFPPKFTYQDFGPMLQMDFFNATDIARIVGDSGAKYLVFTSKHHDGYCNWPSTYSYGWNSMAVGPKRDVIQELKTAFDRDLPDFHFGLYYSLFEWFNTIYLKDKDTKFSTREYALNKMLPEMKELVEKYEPHVLWVDGDWEAPPEYFGSQEFLAWLYNEGPTKNSIVTNDRWGQGTAQKHGGYYSGPDRFSPGTLQAHKWENCMTVDSGSWGIRRNIDLSDILTTNEIIRELASTISCGGNVLLNVGPTKEGTIIPIFQERLKQLGDWMKVNGEAVYDSKPWTHQNDTTNSNVWYTLKDPVVYAFVLEWPSDDVLKISSPKVDEETTVITMLGFSDELKFSTDGEGLVSVEFPSMSKVMRECGSVCQFGYVLRLEKLVEQEPVVIDVVKEED